MLLLYWWIHWMRMFLVSLLQWLWNFTSIRMRGETSCQQLDYYEDFWWRSLLVSYRATDAWNADTDISTDTNDSLGKSVDEYSSYHLNEVKSYFFHIHSPRRYSSDIGRWERSLVPRNVTIKQLLSEDREWNNKIPQQREKHHNGSWRMLNDKWCCSSFSDTE